MNRKLNLEYYFSMNRSNALNIIRSNFKLENCTFLNNHNDAIDLDFSREILLIPISSSLEMMLLIALDRKFTWKIL